ncbi:MAG: divergent polysaccharide deacetylase family protein [Rhizobiaceae bacterium]
MNKEIERPLGQDRRSGGRPQFRFSRGAIAGMVVCFAIVAIAGAIALRPRPFHQAPEIVVSTPQTAASTDVPASRPPSGTASPGQAASAAGRTGPQIIHVNPDTAEQKGAIVIRDPSTIGQDLRTAHLPDRALIEQSEMGPLPIRSIDGRRPVDVYARPWSGTRGARVVIVIGGLGLSQTGTQYAIKKLPGTVTLAFAPQGNSLDRWMRDARQSGHELLMQVPFEPYDYPNVNPGRNTLTVEASVAENLRSLHWALSRITNYVGIMNYMGARFVASENSMEPVMEDLARRGLLYLDDGTSARSVAPQLALKDGVPFAAGDLAIDTSHDRGEILKKLDQLEATARAKGFAIGTGSAFQVTVDAVADWIGEAAKRGIEIVPVTAVMSDPERG